MNFWKILDFIVNLNRFKRCYKCGEKLKILPDHFKIKITSPEALVMRVCSTCMKKLLRKRNEKE